MLVPPELTLFDSSIRTIDQNSPDQTNLNFAGVVFFLDVTVAVGGETLKLNLQWKDPASGKYHTITGFPTISATGTYVFQVYPGAEYSELTGRIRSITGTDPAAGAAMIETVPAGVIWRFISMNVTLVTDSNVANRTVHFFFDDGTDIYLRVTNDQGQSENLTQIYTVANGIHLGFTTPDIQSFPSPANLFLPAGHRIREGTNNFQAGDNWGAPQILVEELPLITNFFSHKGPLPRTWRVNIDHSAAGSWTYSLGVSYLQ